jgi:hypothetical protein
MSGDRAVCRRDFTSVAPGTFAITATAGSSERTQNPADPAG